MQLNPNFLNIQLLRSKINSVVDLSSAQKSLKTTDDGEITKMAGILKSKVFDPMTKELGSETSFGFQYIEDQKRLDESRVKIGRIEVKNDVLNFSCDVSLARYENGVVSLSISPDQPCSSFDYNIDCKSHNAADLNNIMEKLADELFNYFEADLLYIDDSTTSINIPDHLGCLKDKVQHSQYIKLRSGELDTEDASLAVGTDYNPGSRIFTGKLGDHPFARNDAGYYNEASSNQAYYESVTKATEKSGL